jgi:hypothetical protein
MGYGSRALSLLLDFFSGKLVNLDEVQKEIGGESFKAVARVDKVNLATIPPLPSTGSRMLIWNNYIGRRTLI